MILKSDANKVGNLNAVLESSKQSINNGYKFIEPIEAFAHVRLQILIKKEEKKDNMRVLWRKLDRRTPISQQPYISIESQERNVK